MSGIVKTILQYVIGQTSNILVGGANTLLFNNLAGLIDGLKIDGLDNAYVKRVVITTFAVTSLNNILKYVDFKDDTHDEKKHEENDE